MKAIIRNSTVVGILVGDSEDGIPCDESVKVGMRYVSGEFLPALPASIDEIRQQKWNLIKIERDRLTENGGYKVGTKWFHSDQKSRSQQLGLVLLGSNIQANLQWKTMDGTFVPMTQQLAEQILAASAASDQAIFATAEAHKTAMQSSADPAAYDISTGWPEIFGG